MDLIVNTKTGINFVVSLTSRSHPHQNSLGTEDPCNHGNFVNIPFIFVMNNVTESFKSLVFLMDSSTIFSKRPVQGWGELIQTLLRLLNVKIVGRVHKEYFHRGDWCHPLYDQIILLLYPFFFSPVYFWRTSEGKVFFSSLYVSLIIKTKGLFKSRFRLPFT